VHLALPRGIEPLFQP